MSDARFARLRTDPRFRRPRKSAHKVVVDERFKAIFDDGKPGAKKSRSKAGRVDKYGRRVADTKEKDDLRRFYRLEGEALDEQKATDAPRIIDYARGEAFLESSDDDDEAEKDDESDDGEVILGHHPSRPIPVLPSDEQLEIDLNEDEDDDAYADLDAQAEEYAKEHAEEEQPSGDATKTSRLAVVNLDWDHVRASHLYRIFSSLVSPTAARAPFAAPSIERKGNRSSNASKVVRGRLLSVRIYPSEFGKERMKKEELEGPPKEIFKMTRRDDVLPGLFAEDEGDEYDEKALRKYQLERLRYFYAIATFDSAEAAAHVLSELEGTELERSANVFDLSFVPDDMAFDEDARDEATPATVSFNDDYKPLNFATDALRHSKVSLKWDEDDPERNRVTRRALTRKEIEEGDYRAFIASSGSEDSDEEHHQKARGRNKANREHMRKLLLGSKDSDLPEGWGADVFGSGDESGEADMQITFLPGLSETNMQEEETTLDKYKRKQKEKRQARKQERKEKDEETGTSGKRTKSIEDEFFENDSDGGSDLKATEQISEKSRKPPKADKKRDDSPDMLTATRAPATEAELELLVAPDDNSEQRKHFDMRSIIKAEKIKGKKAKKVKKGVNADEVQEDFQIDVKDHRFAALHEDHAFAIDPSNPQFKKTKSMAALLDERSKRHQSVQEEAVTGDASGARSLKSLVESVKRKSTHQAGTGVGKRRKV